MVPPLWGFGSSLEAPLASQIQWASDLLPLPLKNFLPAPVSQSGSPYLVPSLSQEHLKFYQAQHLQYRHSNCHRKIQFSASSVQFSCSVVSDSLRLHELQHVRPPCPLPTPGVYSNSRPLSWWCHPPISSSVVPFSSCLQSFPASGSFPTSQLFASGGQSIGVSASASVLPINVQDWFPLGWTGLASSSFP